MTQSGCGQFAPAVDTELAIERLNVMTDRLRGRLTCRGDLFIGLPLNEQSQHDHLRVRHRGPRPFAHGAQRPAHPIVRTRLAQRITGIREVSFLTGQPRETKRDTGCATAIPDVHEHTVPCRRIRGFLREEQRYVLEISPELSNVDAVVDVIVVIRPMEG